MRGRGEQGEGDDDFSKKKKKKKSIVPQTYKRTHTLQWQKHRLLALSQRRTSTNALPRVRSASVNHLFDPMPTFAFTTVPSKSNLSIAAQLLNVVLGTNAIDTCAGTK